MKYKFINVYDPVHKHYVVLSCGKYSDFKKWLEGRFKDLKLNDTKQTKGKYVSNGSFHFIWLKSKTNLGVLVHECVHLVNHFMEMRNIKYIADNDEAMAYLVEFWFNELKKNLKKL